jgi:hypothetical protein
VSSVLIAVPVFFRAPSLYQYDIDLSNETTRKLLSFVNWPGKVFHLLPDFSPKFRADEIKAQSHPFFSCESVRFLQCLYSCELVGANSEMGRDSILWVTFFRLVSGADRRGVFVGAAASGRPEVREPTHVVQNHRTNELGL